MGKKSIKELEDEKKLLQEEKKRQTLEQEVQKLRQETNSGGLVEKGMRSMIAVAKRAKKELDKGI